MAETKNTFLKGRMNQDLDSRILPNGEYREAINLLISRSEGSTVGEFENVLGNTDYSLQGSLGFVIGHVVDETNNLVYLFTTNYSNAEGLRAPTSSTCTILQFDLTNPTTPTILVSGYWLNFNSAFPIYGVNIMEDLLFWTDNLNQPRRINIITARNSALAYSTESQISVAKYYPYDAVIPLERTTAFVAAQGAGNTTTKITTTALSPNVRVGDVVTDNNKTSFSTLEIDNATPVVKVVKVVSETEFDVAPAIGNGGGSGGALSTGLKIDFSRTSMENRSDQYLSNYSTQTLDTIPTAGSGGGTGTVTNTVIRMLDADLGGLPRVGDIVTNLTSPNNIPNPANPTATAKFNLRISQINVFDVDTNPLGNNGRWTITFDNDATVNGAVTGFAVNDEILIAPNPLYDSNFPGDTKILEDKFVRFSYRFRYNDNEYSLIAPFTQAMFVPKQYGEFGLGQLDQKSTRDNANTEPGINNYYQDEVDAYTSTILNWFENDIDTIGLNIPIPASVAELQTIYNVKEIDILYRQSDGLAIQVLDTIDVDTITSAQTSSVQYDDFVNGLETKLFFNYSYTSNKPYKTLAESQTTRVYDKVPVKALAQEMVGNRIVYGNFLQRQNPPENIDYTVSVTNSDAQTSDFSTEYPFQNIKQNRTYQVGFVLSDYYGRQSDVILSTQDSNENSLGSSIYLPYRVASDATSFPVIDWLGQNLALTIEEAIGSNTDIGLYKEQGHITSFTLDAGGAFYELNQTYVTSGGTGSGCTVRVGTLVGGPPGKVGSCSLVTAGEGYVVGDVLTIRTNQGAGTATITVLTVGEANPLGWYSYKVVVKQQEQEYYNVYLPGFVNGLPVQNQRISNITRPVVAPIGKEEVDTQRGKIGFSTILGDNLNKIPRNLKEVGPTDNEFNSDEIFYVRVNNPNSTASNNSRNLQYYPGNLSQNVLNLATVRETQLAAVPFVAINVGNPSTGLQGEYDSVLGITNQGFQPLGSQDATDIVANTPTGSIPWGDVSSVESFYGADQNPFLMKFSTVGSNNNSIGAIVGGANEVPATFAMRPMLSVVETKPVTSLLDIFWESTMCGRLETLNSYIVTSVNNVIATNIDSGSFSESTLRLANVGDPIKFINGSGAESSNISSVSINKVVSQNNPSIPLAIADYFTIALIGNSGTGTAAQIKTAKTFWYSVNSNNIPSSDVYIFDLQVSTVGNGTPAAPEFTDILPACFTLTLTNEAPVIYEDAAYADATPPTFNIPNPAVIDTNIVQLYALNGSVDETIEDSTENRTKEIIWSITGGGIGVSDFSISSSGLITTNTTLVNEQAYTIFVRADDVNATGTNSLNDVVTIAFTAGTANAPKIIASGSGSGSVAQRQAVKGQVVEFAWINSNTYTGSAVGSPFASAPTFVYNAQTIYNLTGPGKPYDCAGTGRSDLFQGTIEIVPKVLNTNSGVGDASILFSIQYRTYNLINGARGSWENINSVAAGAGYATWSSTQSQQQIIHNTGAANQQTSLKYKFDELGEYRVITNAFGGDSNVGKFTVDFKDGTYSGVSVANPCTP